MGDPKPTSSGDAFWAYLNRFVTVIPLPWMLWLSLAIIDVQSDIAVTHGNSVTATDAFQMRQDLGGLFPSFRDFNGLQTRVEDHESRIDELERGR
jgi:hypothetical protein